MNFLKLIFFLCRRDFHPFKGRFSKLLFLSALGVALGVLTILVFLIFSIGFERDIQKKILSHWTPHLLIRPFVSDSSQSWQKLGDYLEKQKEVQKIYPYKEGYLLTSGDEGLVPLFFSTLPKEFVDVSEEIHNQVWLAERSALRLGLRKGDFFKGNIPQSLSLAEIGKKTTWQVSKIFQQSDYISSVDALVLSEKEFEKADWIAIILKNPYQANEFRSTLSYQRQYQIITWTDRYEDWFSLIKNERILFVFLLFLIIVISSFSIGIVLFISMIQRKRDLALLHLLGLPRNYLLLWFILQGLLVGMLGIFLGCLGACLIAYYRSHLAEVFSIWGFYPFPTYLNETQIPVAFELSYFVSVSFGAIFLCCLATLIPAWRASRANLSEILRDF